MPRLATGIKKPAGGGFLTTNAANLDSSYVNSRRAFLAILDFELYVLTFSQSFETVALDCREVNEHVLAAVSRGDETETLRFVEPLHLTFDLSHLTYFLTID